MANWNAPVIDEFRANQGEVGGHWEGKKLLLLTTIGAKSGMERTNPLHYLPDGERYVVFASKAGAHSHPDWYYNIKANPEVSIEVGSDVIRVQARVLESTERDELYAKQAARHSNFAEYEKGTSRVIPVVALTPIP